MDVRSLYRAIVPRALRDLVGRARGRGSVWRRAAQGWRYHAYTAERWEREYHSDRWRYMEGLPEVARYSVVLGYVRYLAFQGDVLDLGCGEGILQARLGRSCYARYVGVDISSSAIEVANARADEQTRFVCADVTHYEPEGQFDVIVLNEVLYYLSDPHELLRRYEPSLKANGAFVISMFATDETRVNWQLLERHYEILDQTNARNRNSGFAWDCRLLRRRGASQVPIAADRSTRPSRALARGPAETRTSG